MFIRTFAAAAAGLGLAVAPVVSANAGPGGNRADVGREGNLEISAAAYGQAVSDDGCTTTYTNLQAGHTRFTDQYVIFEATAINSCTQQTLGLAGSTETPEILEISDNLSAAHVVATIPLHDTSTGQPAGQLSVDDSWSGTGQAVTSTRTETETFPDGLYSFTSTERTRHASVSGTLPLGVPINTGLLQRYRYSLVQVQRN